MARLLLRRPLDGVLDLPSGRSLGPDRAELCSTSSAIVSLIHFASAATSYLRRHCSPRVCRYAVGGLE